MINILCDNPNVKLPLVKDVAIEFENYFDCDLNILIKIHNGIVEATCGEYVQRVVLTSTTSSVKLALYHLLSRMSGVKKPWGALTGVKPLKPMIGLIESGYNREDAITAIKLDYAISEEKVNLLWEVAQYQINWLYPKDNTYSLYVHIPLCPSKCSYCSFPSETTEEGSSLCDEYLYALAKELKYIQNINMDKSCDTIYIGGGTPSILSLKQIEILFYIIEPFLKTANEVTFEAGRCDTLSYEKLWLLNQMGAKRISLNPQTIHDETLKKINRPVTFEDFLNCYEEAIKAGFQDINTDLIFGLPGENERMFAESVHSIRDISPSSITLHSLCKKRTSDILYDDIESNKIDIAQFQNMAAGMLSIAGYKPYYLYKQKFAVSGAENIGYCRDDKVCIYNIRMMGEHQSIFSAGANSTTKLYFSDTNSFENVYNIKNIDLYIKNIGEVIKKKDKNIKIAYERERKI